MFRLYIDVSKTLPWPANSAPSKDAAKTWSYSESISAILQHLPADEQENVVRFFHIADASRCLGSYLLKHLAIVRGSGVPWSQSTITQEPDIRNGKPFYAPGGLDFNVSHHGNFVVCVGSMNPGAKVGIDIVQIDVQKDQSRMGSGGFASWVNNFTDVLSEREKAEAVGVARRDGIPAGLRMFYTIWACKEAYIKLTSDALMASYIKDLSFPGLKVPTVPASSGAVWGEPITASVFVQGRSVDNARIELVALGRDYIVATAVDQHDELPVFEVVKTSDDGSALECSADAAASVVLQTYSLTI